MLWTHCVMWCDKLLWHCKNSHTSWNLCWESVWVHFLTSVLACGSLFLWHTTCCFVEFPFCGRIGIRIVDVDKSTKALVQPDVLLLCKRSWKCILVQTETKTFLRWTSKFPMDSSQPLFSVHSLIQHKQPQDESDKDGAMKLYFTTDRMSVSSWLNFLKQFRQLTEISPELVTYHNKSVWILLEPRCNSCDQNSAEVLVWFLCDVCLVR